MAAEWPAGEMREGILKVYRKRESKQRGRPVYSYKVPYRDATGKQTSQTWATLKEARAFRDQVRSGRRAGILPDYKAGAASVASWADEWLEAVRTARREATYRTYRSWVRRYIGPELGALPVRAVTSADVQRAVTAWSDRIAPWTVRLVYRALRALMAAAVEADMRPKTPCAGIKLPEVPESRDAQPFTADDVDAIGAGITPRFRVLVALGAGLGLRMGEMLGLSWDRVDLEAGTVTIDRQLQRGKLVPVKSKTSRRVLPLPDTVAAALRDHARTYPPRPVPVGTDGATAELVLYQDTGRPVSDSSARYHFKQACKAAGIPGAVKVHGLRHTFASLLIDKDISPKKIQTWMGHSSISVTMDVYGHLYEGSEAGMCSAIDDALGSDTPAPGGVPGDFGTLGSGSLTP